MWQRRYPHRHGQWEAHLSFLPDGTLLTSAQQGETLVWDASAGRILRRYPIGGRFALSPDRRRIAIARNSPSPGDPSSSITVLHLPHREARGPRLAPQRQLDRRPGLHARREADRRRSDRRDHACGTSPPSDIVETYGTKLGPPTGAASCWTTAGSRWTAGSTAP